MATAGPNSPATVTNWTSGWDSPSNAAVSDGAFATISVTGVANSNHLAASNFGFSIPDTDEVTATSVEIQAKTDGGSESYVRVSFMLIGGSDTGPIFGTLSSALSTTLEYKTVEPAQTRAVTASEANDNSGFGVGVNVFINESATRTISIDHIRVTLTHEPAGHPAMRRMMNVPYVGGFARGVYRIVTGRPWRCTQARTGRLVEVAA